ncbi:hypothetical protein [Flavilitoribacter nigricans]|uniref:Stationary phase survival protein SurE n=1 Tax=Flavilitoribacter nigricans (strain ATCC 23147 / DSM 23189 / NBRC 102662 / NCIMB 1420 / SS-2) TaxID=1122177 RepID=A0A2D0N7J9_FLAN2|nr:hypothetical protein [Flavilitoribacter nigricans]PHN04109.1 hypothetical protein CRP01_23210 [Flavilitoribacter nigricans DSM 23189 = NBRC 102662]
MLKNRNEIWIGLVVGLLLPFVGYALLLSASDYIINNNLGSGFRPRSLALIAVCLNIIPMNVFMSRGQGQSMRGLLIMTIVYAVVWFLYFRESLFG